MFNMDVINVVLIIAIIGLVIMSIIVLIKNLRKNGKIEKADLSPLYENSSSEDETIEGAAKKVQRATGIRQEDMNKVVGALKISTEKIDELAKKTFSYKKEKPMKDNIVKTQKAKESQKTVEKSAEEKIKDDGFER